MRYLAQALFILISQGLADHGFAEVGCRVESDWKKYCEKSFFSLLPDAASSDGDYIRITGYIREEDDGFVLYFDQERADMGLASESIAIVASNPEAMHLNRFKEHYVLVKGVFSTKSLPGNSRRVAKIDVSLPVFPAVFRASQADQEEFRRAQERKRREAESGEETTGIPK